MNLSGWRRQKVKEVTEFVVVDKARKVILFSPLQTLGSQEIVESLDFCVRSTPQERWVVGWLFAL